MTRTSRVPSSLGAAIVLFACAAARAQQPPQFTEITMFIGEQRVVPALDVQSYSEGTTGIVQVKIPRDGTRMVVTTVQAGQTSLLLIYRDGRQATWLITVYRRPPAVVIRELSELLEGVPGVAIRQVGSRIFVEGRVPTEAYVKQAGEVARQYGDQVVGIVQLDPTKVEKKVNIKLDVYFVEFSRRRGYNFGLNWPGQLPGPQTLRFSYDLQSRSTTAATYSITQGALPTLDLLSYSGWVKILKQSTMITTNGSKARYVAGGEVNVAVSGVGGGDVKKIPFGTDVTVTPRFDAPSGRVDLDLEAEASELSEALVAGGIPGRTTATVQTLVHLGMGQSVMLSGIKARTARESQSGWPLFRHIPILGYLFRSDSSAEADTEGAIFITPTVLYQITDADRQRLQDLMRRYQTFEG